MIIFSYNFHLVFSILFLLFIDKYFIDLNIISVYFMLLTFHLPDLDIESSKVSKKFKITSLIICFLSKHRGFMHSLITFSLVSSFFNIIAYILDLPNILYGSMIGYGSHLLGDMSTPMGIPLLWPLKFRFKIPILCKFKYITKIIWILLFSYLLMEDVEIIHRIKNILLNNYYLIK
ncbi:MAG: metal-dependent hydrolase [archaeon]